MASVCVFIGVVLLSYLLPISNGYETKCPTRFDCGYLRILYFPYTTTKHKDCGILAINGCDDGHKVPKTIVSNKGRLFDVINVSYSNSIESIIIISDLVLHDRLRNRSCEAFSDTYDLPLTFSPLASLEIRNYGPLFRCNRPLHVRTPEHFLNLSCGDSYIYYGLSLSNKDIDQSLLSACSFIQFPMKDLPDSDDPFTFVTSEIVLQVRLSHDCCKCHHNRAGLCRLDSNKVFYCCHRDDTSRALKLGLGLGLGLGIGLPAIMMIGWLIGRHYKRKYSGADADDDQFQSRNIYSDTFSNPDPEIGNVYFEVPLFSYKELQDATNKFDHARTLGDGGFGIVYYGKLQDGREVAVKRLYEHNYRRAEQFRNEVEILTKLRHKNLVSLYGCTSRQSRELLLVYEYISNGTVASHLHGDSSKLSPLSWPIRIKIAIETASVLAYLHASDIIHRDVKTNNILLDNNFNVKVADFGLSRLFPDDVTHVSTAPQGTPGYVDPEYYQCYKLTSKSDVYSFGVVLMELISSKPAVDISRSNDEVNLSSLAVKKIQESAFSEIVDPCLGIEKDSEVKRMVVLVGELAFQCLQRDKESRPSMDEVLEVLKRIESGKGGDEDVDNMDSDNVTSIPPMSPSPPSPMSRDREEVGLLRKVNLPPASPNTVTDKWKSESTTPNIST